MRLMVPVRHLELLAILHPHHLDVGLRHLTLKGGPLLLSDLQILQLFGELNNAS